MTTSPSDRDHVRGRKVTPRGWLISAIILLYFAAMLVGPYYLAPMLSGDGSPTRHDINGTYGVPPEAAVLVVQEHEQEYH